MASASVVHVRVRWKGQKNPACTKSVRVFRRLKLDTIRKKKKKKKKKKKLYKQSYAIPRQRDPCTPKRKDGHEELPLVVPWLNADK